MSELLTFGAALEAIKQGKTMGRKAWNDDTRFVLLIAGSVVRESIAGFYGDPDDGDGKQVYGDALYIATPVSVEVYTPTYADLLAEDWVELGRAE